MPAFVRLCHEKNSKLCLSAHSAAVVIFNLSQQKLGVRLGVRKKIRCTESSEVKEECPIVGMARWQFASLMSSDNVQNVR